MTIGDVFKRKLDLRSDYKKVLDKVHSETGSYKGRELRNLNLEKQLKEMFYDDKGENNNKIYNDVLKLGTGSLEERLKIIAESINITNGQITFSGVTNKENINESQSRLYLANVNTLIASIQKKLLAAIDARQIESIPLEISKAIKLVQNQLKDLQDKMGKTGKIITKKGEGFSDLRRNVEILKHLSKLIDGMPSANALGKALELGAKEAFENIKNKGESDISEVLHTGGTQVSRAVMNNGNSLSVHMDFKNLENILGAQMPKHVSKKIKGKNFEVNVTPTGKSSAKADLIVKFQADIDPYRFSLKNWSSVFNSKENFGSTYLLNAIARSSGESSLRNYALGLLANYEAQVHEFARLCIAADILMGIAQEGHSANYLVINSRAQSRIYVYNIGALIDKMGEALEIIGYNRSSLHYGALKILRSLGKNKRTDRYLPLAYGMLYSTIVSAKLSAAALSALK